MKTFREYFEDQDLDERQDQEQKETKEFTATFGRFNPPTIGHEKLFNKVEEVARGGDFKIFVSQTHQNKNQRDEDKLFKDPIAYDDKVKFMKEMFPAYENDIVYDTNIRTLWDILTQAYDNGYTKFTLVVGDDRLGTMTELIKKYHGKEGAHGFYEFPDGLEFKTAGKRVEGAEGVEGMSASKMRQLVKNNDEQGFFDSLPDGFIYKRELFDAVNGGLGWPSDEEVAAIRGF